MTKSEMDAAILEAVNETQIVNVRSLAFRRWRRIYVAGMKEGAEIYAREGQRANVIIAELENP